MRNYYRANNGTAHDMDDNTFRAGVEFGKKQNRNWFFYLGTLIVIMLMFSSCAIYKPRKAKRHVCVFKTQRCLTQMLNHKKIKGIDEAIKACKIVQQQDQE